MLRISCTQLEKIRKNPTLFGEILATADERSIGGTYGMFARWQTMARKIHKENKTLNEAVMDLASEYTIHLKNTSVNRAKGELLIEGLVKYFQAYDEIGFNFISWKKLINWNITPDVRLTGQTPLLVSRGEKYTAYFIVETIKDWQNELRFPLLQKYFTDIVLNCKSNDLQIGVYNINSSSFELKIYDGSEIRQAEQETKTAFNLVFDSYKSFKL